MSQFTESKALFSMHMDMAEKCMEVFSDNKLLDLASVEQASLWLGKIRETRLTDPVSCNWPRRGLQKAQELG